MKETSKKVVKSCGIRRTIPKCLRSTKLKALKGRTILARGTRDSLSAPPRVSMPKNKLLTAMPREIASGAATANLICGILHLFHSIDGSWRVALAFFLFISAPALQAQTNLHFITVWKSMSDPAPGHGIQYGEAGGQKLLLDAHIPDGTGPFPVLIIVHGGGWMGGDKEGDIVPVFAPYATRFTWFTINYRLAPTNHWPACFDDLQTAVHWVKQHATEYKGDPDHIALLGYSAGGHLVTLAGTLAAADLHVQAIVGMAPPTDLVWDNERRGGLSTSMRNLFDFATTNITDERRVVLKRYSPLTCVRPGLQPFLLVQGTADRSVPFRGTTNFMAALQRANVSCDLLVITNGQHAITDWSKYHPGWQKPVVSWLNEKLAR